MSVARLTTWPSPNALAISASSRQLLSPLRRLGQAEASSRRREASSARRRDLRAREGGCSWPVPCSSVRWASMRTRSSLADYSTEVGKPSEGESLRKEHWGVLVLISINLVVFALDHLLRFPLIKSLYLNQAHPALFQFVTSLFCHGSWGHLSGNLFFLLVFGKLVEEEEGAWGLVLSYLICGIGGNIASVIMLGKKVVSLGASGSVFGLFAVSVLVRFRPNIFRLIEAVILGQFVIGRLRDEAAVMLAVKSTKHYAINHVAHVGGALFGVLFFFICSKLSSGPE